MVTGVECAGLVLAVLPLVIEAAKIYGRGAEDLRSITLKSHHDDELEDFCEDFLFEITILNSRVKDLVSQLPELSDERKVNLIKEIKLQDWQPESDVAAGLQAFFGCHYNAFTIVVQRIVKLLANLTRDRAVPLSADDTASDDETNTYLKLKAFYSDRKAGQTSTSLKERFRFWKGADKREKNLLKLQKSTQKLERLMARSVITPIQTPSQEDLPHGWQKSIDQVYILGHVLYSAFTKCWTCSCDVRHEARFCLNIIEDLSNKTDFPENDFGFLIQAAADGRSPKWREGIIKVRRNSSSHDQSRVTLARICDAIKNVPGETYSLHVLVEDLQDAPKVWQLRPQPRRLQVVHTKPSITLHQLLLASAMFPLKLKRELALTVALSTLGLHEDTWLGNGWGKESISFFHNSDDRPEYRKPFLSTYFEDLPLLDNLNIVACHCNRRILGLGILLIEIHTGRPIEYYRTDNDLSNGIVNEFTDFGVAIRIADSLIDCSLDYQDAIRVCLNPPWVPSDQKVSLHDPRVRQGIYVDVVQRLRNELKYLFRMEL